MQLSTVRNEVLLASSTQDDHDSSRLTQTNSLPKYTGGIPFDIEIQQHPRLSLSPSNSSDTADLHNHCYFLRYSMPQSFQPTDAHLGPPSPVEDINRVSSSSLVCPMWPRVYIFTTPGEGKKTPESSFAKGPRAWRTYHAPAVASRMCRAGMAI
uniref:Uncharacterized protein n=1 Tax=Strigamia maritima TaxID=126957 RepID=T1IST4_STRMM